MSEWYNVVDMLVVTLLIYDAFETLNTVIDDDAWYRTLLQSIKHFTE